MLCNETSPVAYGGDIFSLFQFVTVGTLAKEQDFFSCTKLKRFVQIYIMIFSGTRNLAISMLCNETSPVAYGGPSSWVFTYCKKAYRTLGGKPPRPPSYPPTYVSIYGIPITYDQQLLISKMKIYLLRFSHTST